MSRIVVAALYHFAALEDYRALRAPLLAEMERLGVKGTLLLAREGINGTVAGERAAIDALLAKLKADPRLQALTHKESYCDEQPFKRTKVKLKKEIVTMGVEAIDPRDIVGTYVKPADWNALISDPDVTVIDTRNDYEVNIGSFRHAVNPNTASFREFPDYAAENLDPKKHKKVAMFCTGGIRCEKSTAYLKAQGFEEVYHLEGGILKYLEEVPEAQSLWQGECFVFDDRVTVDHQLQRGQYELCGACRQPLSPTDRDSEHYVKGISCPHCIERTSAEQRARFAEREKQLQLARARGEQHIGSEARRLREQRRQQKLEEKNRQRAVDRQGTGQ